MSPAAPVELAVHVDRTVRGGAEEALSRAEHAIARATDAAGRSADAVLDAASAALGVRLSLTEDATVTWSAPDAVCVGEVPVGRLTADRADASVEVA